MAKTDKAPPPAAKKEPPLPKISSPPSAAVMNAYRIVKALACIVGFVATMISLMAVIGALTDNGYARVLGALVVTLAVPLGVGDRLLPADDPTRAKGIITEVMAVTWVLFGLVFATLANGATRGMLTREGDRLRRDGYESVAAVAYFLGGVRAIVPPPTPAPEPSASASSSATAATTAAATVTATETASATPSASASSSAAPKDGKAEKTPAELFKELSPAVVTIFVHTAAHDGSGTGFVIDREGTIVTNHHVVDDLRSVKIKFMNGAIYTSGDILADDPRQDLAILRVPLAKPFEGEVPTFTPVALGDSDAVQVGERAISIGNPLGLEHTLTDGLVSARRVYEGRQWIQMSVPISPGNSGGPLFDMRGEVIGISTAQIAGGFERAQNLNLAVPVNDLKKMIRTDYPDKKKIGGGNANGQW
ncbi:MAG: trypsin-like peptidase domain-containing protein [Polyangiaceae bacterium]